MNYIYPAVFYPEEDGRYSVIFPDLNDLATYGDTLADAFAMAQEACGQYLFTSYETVSTFLHRLHSMTFKKKMLMHSSIWYV